LNATPTLPRRCLAEMVGTYLLVFFGCGAVHAAVLTGAHSGLWQVASLWGVAVLAAIYAVGAISGAHLNPAMTVAFWCWRGFPAGHVVPYVVSQVAGAFLAAATLFALFEPYLERKERDLGIARGEAGSEMTACCYGEYYPNPGGLEKGWPVDSAARSAALEQHYRMVSEGMAFLTEFLGTLFLALVVMAVSDPRREVGQLSPLIIGLAVAMIIGVIAPLTQACINPARDFGPRLWTYCAGWGERAIPGPNGRGFCTVYILAPLAGAWAGGGLYCSLLTERPRKEIAA